MTRLLNGHKLLLAWVLMACCLLPVIAGAETVYFVVSEPNPEAPHGDSYVLPLDDAADIEHARDLIANGPSIGGAIAVAEIAPGANGINRDMLARGKPQWSWHVVNFEGFADATIEILDGWPGFIEQDVDFWMQNTDGFIGFWSYTVTAELGQSPFFQINAGLNDAWYNPETSGQGLFITVFPDLGHVSLAWFTYDTFLPADDAMSNLGDPGHRWLTALGTFQDNHAEMDVTITSGGLFDTQTETDRRQDGIIVLSFDGCNSATVEYDIPSINRQGTVPIQRVAVDNIGLCEELNTGPLTVSTAEARR